jgi:diguanylate cyclase (GGDEF)-like protein
VARYGGEEFIIALPETKLQGAISVAEAICSAIAALTIPHKTSSVSDKITVSMGISSQIPTLDISPDRLIDLADQALYLAKEQGRNRYCVQANP